MKISSDTSVSPSSTTVSGGPSIVPPWRTHSGRKKHKTQDVHIIRALLQRVRQTSEDVSHILPSHGWQWTNRIMAALSFKNVRWKVQKINLKWMFAITKIAPESMWISNYAICLKALVIGNISNQWIRNLIKMSSTWLHFNKALIRLNKPALVNY